MAKCICSIEHCEQRVVARGWCDTHYRRWKRHGDPSFVRPPTEKALCQIDGCENLQLARGWCKNHYYRWYRRGGDPSQVERGKGLPFDHRAWEGTYRGVHAWINDHFPRTGRCEYCARTDRLTEYACIGHRYTRNRADWFELCRLCHRALDGTSDSTRAKRSANAKARWAKRKEQMT